MPHRQAVVLSGPRVAAVAVVGLVCLSGKLLLLAALCACLQLLLVSSVNLSYLLPGDIPEWFNHH